MTEQEKQTLSNDLCSRLQFGIKAKTLVETLGISKGSDIKIRSYEYDLDDTLWINGAYEIDEIKPYLRSMSRMSQEEIKEYIRLRHKDCIDVERPAHCCENSITAVVVSLTSRESMRFWYNHMVSADTIDFLNARHLDWRGLIPVGLALEAPEKMYY